MSTSNSFHYFRKTLSKILGHSKITTTQLNAKVLNQKVSTDMGNLKMMIEAKKEKQIRIGNRIRHNSDIEKISN